jgi:hypothetical protein
MSNLRETESVEREERTVLYTRGGVGIPKGLKEYFILHYRCRECKGDVEREVLAKGPIEKVYTLLIAVRDCYRGLPMFDEFPRLTSIHNCPANPGKIYGVMDLQSIEVIKAGWRNG